MLEPQAPARHSALDSSQSANSLNNADVLGYQAEALSGVSRTFALTIPQLPMPLRDVVGNAYLLCRIADTIEDEANLPLEKKEAYLHRFVHVVEGRASARDFGRELHPMLSEATIEAERNLVANMDTVVGFTHGLRRPQRAAIERCIGIMAPGMAEFQAMTTVQGLRDMRDFDRYCYCVAGVVGETITELLCDHSPAIRGRRDRLFSLSAGFGQGLQMVNILKDFWEDRERGACWLPRDVFAGVGIDLSTLVPGKGDARKLAGALYRLIRVAAGHLGSAFQYTMLIPAREAGIRRFLLWSLGMAVQTLGRLAESPAFINGEQVKISRKEVRAIVLATSALVRWDRGLGWMFDRAVGRIARAR